MGTFESEPPAEAYSRVTRDLAAVCADFIEWLDTLPEHLEQQFQTSSTTVDGMTVIEPASPRAAPLRVERQSHPAGGVGARFWFGHAASGWVVDCLCDACGGTSSEFIEAGQRLVDVVTGGFREYRRPHVPRRGERLHRGPWLEVGYEAESGAGACASADIKGDLFDVIWEPWPAAVPKGDLL